MLSLYPSIKPYAMHHVSVNERHTLYVEESGNSRGIPVVFLHGGPGVGCDPDHRRFFDPSLYRIILFDQRGAGQSTPYADLEGNTTQNLVSDMEVIRVHLGIERWVLFGGSWGSTLALVYAQTHPERVLNMILRGIFLCRPEEFDWFYKPGGASRIFPEAWEKVVNHLHPNERDNILESYYKRLTGPDELQRMSAAKVWSEWEGICSCLLPNPQVVNYMTEPHKAVSIACIETHYFMNNAFLEPNQILNNMERIAEIPGIIVHGRYDLVCPVDNAFALHEAWPNSTLEIIRDAGHSACEAGIIHALVSATNSVAKRNGS